MHAWNGYKNHAWGKETLKPISGTPADSIHLCDLGLTLVDSLDTLWILGLFDEFEHAVNATKDLDFANPKDCVINLFEWNIRYLGGFLAAYELSGNEVLLRRAITVGDILMTAFETHNRMPAEFFAWPR